MYLYTNITRGTYHPVYCEDFQYHQWIGDRFLMAAVMDGCSSGDDSHFASALFGKLLRKIATKLDFEIFKQADLQSCKALARRIIYLLMEELRQFKSEYLIHRDELLATLILHIHDKELKESFIIALGDGVIVIDSEVTDIDQNNRPDYPAYHLNKAFEEWYDSQVNTFFVKNPSDISIATDGVTSFLKSTKRNIGSQDFPLYELLIKPPTTKNTNLLRNTIEWLELKHDLRPYDDIGIIRVVF